MSLTQEELLGCYETMRLIRSFEETILRLHGEGALPGFMHVSIGQEAIPAGVSLHLRADDQITTTHRGHGDVIAKGARVEAMLAELYARTEGLCRGKGGSMHVTDVSRGVLGANGIVAAGLPIAVGAALSAKRLETDRVAVAYFGDGAIAEGTTHEALNMAALWKLPVVFVRQNNQYAESTPRSDYQGMPDVLRFVAGYGFPSEQVDGNDVEVVADAAGRAIGRARQGDGPSFLECDTYRHFGHNIGDTAAWRPEEEVAHWKANDPLLRARARLVEVGLGEERLDRVDAEAAERMDRAVAYAESLPEPPEAWALEDVFADPATLTAMGGEVR